MRCHFSAAMRIVTMALAVVLVPSGPLTAQSLSLLSTGERVPCLGDLQGCTPRDPYHDNCSDPWFTAVSLAALGIVVPPHLAGSIAWGHNNFRSACIRHDHCYHHGYCSYGKSKAACDIDFQTQMRASCDNVSVVEKPLCRKAAEVLYQGVSRSEQAARAYLGVDGYFNCYAGVVGCKLPSAADHLAAWW